MAKLPPAHLPRSLLPPSSSTSGTLLLLSTTSYRPATRIPTAFRPQQQPQQPLLPRQQVRHATQVVRPKRPYTWTQVVQLSDGSTYTSRSTSPLPVYRSTKDTRNHLTWQPSESSLQNVEVDEAGKLASFRGRFGSGYELAGPTAAEKKAAAAAAAAAAADGGKKADGKKAKGARMEEVKEEAGVGEEKVEEEDSYASLMATYVRDQPNLKGGQVAAKVSGKKGKK